MDNFTEMLVHGMQERGHTIQVWHPRPVFSKLALGKAAKKWLGYMDQYLLFPVVIRTKLKKCKRRTLFVFTDQALGPWVPMVKNRMHVIHCHDFLALQSALGLIPENKTRWLGKKYQGYIRRGFSKGKNFIAVSKQTSNEAALYIDNLTCRNEVVYNGLNKDFTPVNPTQARKFVNTKTSVAVSEGYIMHVGGNQWYKNRKGVVEIYNAWRQTSKSVLPLLLIGERPSNALYDFVSKSTFEKDIYFICGQNNEFIRNAYSGASVLLFPSFAEGFGWPIAEAMACGCRVLTTNLEPMTEVGSDAAFYIGRRPLSDFEAGTWALNAAELLENIISVPESTRNLSIEAGIKNSKRFDLNSALDSIETIYSSVFQENS